MSDTFTASNGITITVEQDCSGEVHLLGKGGEIAGGDRRWTECTSSNGGIAALREFFQHERDKELGRWRWPEDPGIVVYPAPSGNRVRALSEATGESEWQSRDQDDSNHWVTVAAWYYRSAAAYFAAHPEPKPWHDAKPGEVWAVTWDGSESACRVVENEISSNGLVFDDTTRETPGTLAPVITDARRIWPEVPSE